MLLEQVAQHFAMTPLQVQQESLRLYLERKLRLVESELFTLAQRYGVKSIAEMDAVIQAGQFHEAETFEDYFRLDYLESERDTLHTLLEQL
jgi:hypothetical protein